MKKIFSLLAISAIIVSCSNDDDGTMEPAEQVIEAPATYSFSRNNETTISFSGQTTRILMAEEIISAMKDFDNATQESLSNMFVNENNPFSTTDLNESSKDVKSKIAASRDLFNDNTADAAAIKLEFENYLFDQIGEVFPAETTLAEPGIAGQIADGSSTRYVNSKGFEYNQLFNKSLIGALMIDQALNNYLGESVLDEATNIDDNNNEVLVDGKNYTTMEHKWDEAYGYVYGLSPSVSNPNETIGDDDNFLNKYIGRVEGDTDFEGIADDIFNAFKLGRAAIVGQDYELRDEQADVLRAKISEVVGVRSVYYLQQGKNALISTPVDYGAAFHDISEGYGFIYSLQFTRIPGTNDSYFSRAEVLNFLDQLNQDNGLWDVSPETLDAMSEEIASRFAFTVTQAKS